MNKKFSILLAIVILSIGQMQCMRRATASLYPRVQLPLSSSMARVIKTSSKLPVEKVRILKDTIDHQKAVCLSAILEVGQERAEEILHRAKQSVQAFLVRPQSNSSNITHLEPIGQEWYSCARAQLKKAGGINPANVEIVLTDTPSPATSMEVDENNYEAIEKISLVFNPAQDHDYPFLQKKAVINHEIAHVFEADFIIRGLARESIAHRVAHTPNHLSSAATYQGFLSKGIEWFKSRQYKVEQFDMFNQIMHLQEYAADTYAVLNEPELIDPSIVFFKQHSSSIESIASFIGQKKYTRWLSHTHPANYKRITNLENLKELLIA